ncbi:MAG: hypothetical protein P8J42_07515 [Pseudomonadales bacterium]|nr:hypothetical protein [Pseudomonadales bacterium]
MKSPNPQGKGVVPLLAAWESMSPLTVANKPAGRILGEYFTSLLILSAEFSFKPVPQKSYYLYWKPALAANNKPTAPWRLSLIEPDRLGDLDLGVYVGRCILQYDMTWSIELAEALHQHSELIEDLHQFHQHFQATNNDEESLETHLPFFVEQLPFYRRLAATALSSSLSRSIQASELDNIPARQWLAHSGSSSLGLLQN